MTFLSLKALVWDQERKKFFSPSQTDFWWGKEDKMAAQCSHTADYGKLDLNCHCGIYSSPNIATIDEYANFPNSVLFLLNNYGMADIWTAPDDIPNCYVMRTWAARVVGVVKEGITLGRIAQCKNTPNRMACMLWASQYFGVRVYDLSHAETLMRLTWPKAVGFDPFDVASFPR